MTTETPPGTDAQAPVTATATESRFSLAFVFFIAAYVGLLGATGFALSAFFHPFAAWLGAAVLSFVFTGICYLLFTGGIGVVWKLIALVLGIVFGTATTSLSSSTLFAVTSAPEAVRKDLEAKKLEADRSMDRVLVMVDSAQKAMEAWAKNAGEKSTSEADKGNSCPSVESNAKPGPISQWRDSDAKMADHLAKDLAALADKAKTAVAAVKGRPPANTFAEAKASLPELNAAIDAIAPLLKGGYPEGALSTLGERRSSQIEYPDKKRTCGDTGRLALIERASQELAKLAAISPLPRVAPAIDLSKHSDVVSKSLERGLNITLKLISFGQAGSFKADPLMEKALSQSGIVNELTLPYFLSILAEAAVVGTAFLAARQGRTPFGMDFAAWVRRKEASGTSSWLKGLMTLVGKLLANLFWRQHSPVQADAATNPANPAFGNLLPAAAGLEAAGFAAITLNDDPSLPARELAWAAALAEWHHAWGIHDYIVLPVAIDSAANARHMVRSMAAHGLVKPLAGDATLKHLSRRPPLVAYLRQKLGSTVDKLYFEVWEATPSLGQLIRLAALGHGPAGPAVTATVAQPVNGSARRPHVPFSRKLRQRQQGWPAAMATA